MQFHMTNSSHCYQEPDGFDKENVLIVSMTNETTDVWTIPESPLWCKDNNDSEDDSISCSSLFSEEGWNSFLYDRMAFDDETASCTVEVVSMQTSSNITNSFDSSPCQPNVTFGNVRIREYGVTVGAYTASSELCPMQLTWEYNPIERSMTVDEHHMSRSWLSPFAHFYRTKVRRLSISQRRSRIGNVQGISCSSVARLEYDTVYNLDSRYDDDVGYNGTCHQSLSVR